MTEDIRQIALRIKELREIYDTSVPALAKQLNITEQEIKDFESGEHDIPISYLTMVAKRFHVEVSALLTGQEPKLHDYCLVRNGKGVWVERQPQYKYQSLAYNISNKVGEPFLVSTETKDPDEPVHTNTHAGQEFDFVLSGMLQFVLGGKEIILYEGDSVYFNSEIPHGFKALGDKPAQWLAFVFQA